MCLTGTRRRRRVALTAVQTGTPGPLARLRHTRPPTRARDERRFVYIFAVAGAVLPSGRIE